jgi:hypothetical protein
MYMVGTVVMALAVVGYLGCRIAKIYELYVLRGASFQVTFSRPAAALDSNYAVIAVRLVWLWLAIFSVGFVLLLAAGAPYAA